MDGVETAALDQEGSDFLADFARREEAMSLLGKLLRNDLQPISVRTMERLEAEVDGLPHIIVRNRKLYHLPSLRDWLLRRQRSRNPRREGKRHAAGA